MIAAVSVCNITWWMIALSSIVPAIIGWFLAKQFAKDSNENQRLKIKQLQTELKECYEQSQIITANLDSPKKKFSEVKKGKAKQSSKNRTPKK